MKANKDCSFCEPEIPIGGIIPDVYAIIRGQKVTIEIQRSKMTVEEAYNRTISCYKIGLLIIWIIPNMDELGIYRDEGENVCNAKKWKAFFHSLFYGRLYVWSG